MAGNVPNKASVNLVPNMTKNSIDPRKKKKYWKNCKSKKWY